ncbi:RIP metalloprotease RseP [Campylobacter sp. CCS1377]|uniref:Zinc metalloprotease n=1 Tax=Campylobacter sp. CCS1377 TaxID=3158229 RepID=A0AAU7E9P6_9BACT
MKTLLFLLIILIIGFKFYSFEFLVTLLVISFLIFFHELGHFLAAKSLGVKVEVFSIGFGKTLIKKTYKNTEYRLSALPLGGYVKLKGQDDLNPTEENYDKDSYSILSPLKKIYILVAGPFFNIFLAFLLYIAIGNLGLIKPAAQIGKIMPDSAAQMANLQAGDKILAIDGKAIQSFDEISKFLSPKETTLLIQRGDQKLNVTLTPKIGTGYNEFLQPIQKPLLGITQSTNTTKIYHTGLDSVYFAFDESINASLLIVKGLVKLIAGQIDPQNLGGIITMVDVTSKAANNGLVVLFFITALISINLGILNLLPIPMLDGGHIVFNIYEMLFGKKVHPKVFEYLSYGGMILLLSLMLFATYNDIARLLKL